MKKDRRRLVLNGSDDAYARREAVKDGGGAAEEKTGPHREPGRAATPLKPDPAPRPKREPLSRDQEPGVQGPVGPAQPVQEAIQAIQVNYRLNLGEELSEQLQRLADAHDQPIELIMKGLRTRAADRFRTLASGSTKPEVPDPAPGGLATRFAAAYCGAVAAKLNAWFDPFGLGVAKDAIKPILVALFQEEAEAICDGMEMPRNVPPR